MTKEGYLRLMNGLAILVLLTAILTARAVANIDPITENHYSWPEKVEIKTMASRETNNTEEARGSICEDRNENECLQRQQHPFFQREVQGNGSVELHC